MRSHAPGRRTGRGRSLKLAVGARLRALKPQTAQDRNILYVALDGLTVGLAIAAMTFLSVFVVRLGADAFWVSLITSLPALIKLVLTLPLSRYVERRTRIVSVFAWSRLIGRSSYFVIGLLPFLLDYQSAAKAIVLLWGAAAVVGGIQQISFSLVMNGAASRDRRAVMVSTRWTVMGVAKVLVLFLAGLVLKMVAFPLNYQLLFLSSFLASLLGFYTINRVRIADDAPSRADRERSLSHPWQRLKESAREIGRNGPFVKFVLGRNIYWLGISMTAPLIPIYYIENLRASDAWISYFSTALTITSLISYAFWVRLKKRRGNRLTLLVSVLGRALFPLLVAISTYPGVMLAVSAFNGVVFAGMNLMFFETFMDTLPRGREARFLAVNQTLTNLTGFMAPSIGVWLLSLLGMRTSLLLGSAIALAGFLSFLVGGVARPSVRPSAVGQP